MATQAYIKFLTSTLADGKPMSSVRTKFKGDSKVSAIKHDSKKPKTSGKRR